MQISAGAVRQPAKKTTGKVDRVSRRRIVFLGLDHRRAALGLSISRWARLAGVSPDVMAARLRADRAPSGTSLAKLRLALGRFEAGRGDDLAYAMPPVAVKALCDALVVACAQALKVPVALCHALDAARSARGAAADDVSRQAHLARGLAYYAANQIYGITQAEIAAAFGIDRAAVCRAMPKIEDRRDDPAFEAVVQNLARMMNQRGAM